jgi:hypothetical protein
VRAYVTPWERPPPHDRPGYDEQKGVVDIRTADVNRFGKVYRVLPMVAE